MGLYANGTNYGKTIDPSSANILDPGTCTGKLRVMQDYFNLSASATMGSNDYVKVGGKLPIGSQVVSIILGYPAACAAGAAATSSYIMVGDEGDPNRYITAVQVSVAAVVIGPNNITGLNYVVTGTTDNYIRISGYDVEADADNTSVISTGPIKISVMYVVE